MPESHDNPHHRHLKYNKSIGQKIRTMRLQNGRSQSELADRLGITYQQIQKYENGTTRIPAFIIPVLTDFFNTSCHEFFEQDSADRTSKVTRRRLDDEIDKICYMLRETNDTAFVMKTRHILKAMINGFSQE